MKAVKKIWDIATTIVVVAVVILAILMVGVRFMGLQVYTVLSGSMEPQYQTGSLIYVKKVDPYELKADDVITYMLDEDTVSTHRIVEVVPDEDEAGVIRFVTKGDANDAIDAVMVHYKNVIGTPVYSIPKLGYVANFIQSPKGRYMAISGVAVLVLLMILPDLLKPKDGGKAKSKGEKPDKENLKKGE